MRYISICSGIEAATVAWASLGWTPICFAEIDPFPCAVLAHHYPNIPNLGDISKIDWRPYAGQADVVVGGTPCQSFSVAGKREGLDGASGLVREYFRLLREVRPSWFVWENVPGALSSNNGEDFKFILRQWDDCGYHVAWRILDAQYFGVPQRRRRIFAVGHIGNWQSPAKVLFESESMSGNPAPSRETGQDAPAVAGTLSANCGSLNRPAGNCNELDFCIPIDLRNAMRNENQKESGCGIMNDNDRCPTLSCVQVPRVARGFTPSSFGGYPEGVGTLRASCGVTGGGSETLIAKCLTVHGQRYDPETENLLPIMMRNREGKDGGGKGPLLSDKSLTLACNNDQILFQQNIYGIDYEQNISAGNEAIGPLLKGSPTGGGRPLPAVMINSLSVRRLTPLECERLQGFPDNYTRIPYRGKPADDCPDGPRYKALGNSMCVNVMKWIGERMERENNNVRTT